MRIEPDRFPGFRKGELAFAQSSERDAEEPMRPLRVWSERDGTTRGFSPSRVLAGGQQRLSHQGVDVGVRRVAGHQHGEPGQGLRWAPELQQHFALTEQSVVVQRTS